MGETYITNPSAQQGEPMHRKDSVRPANIEASSELLIPAQDRLQEGPVDFPGHLGQPSKPARMPGVNTPDTSPQPMGEKIGR